MNPKWSEEEQQFLVDNRYMSTAEISEALGRSKDSVKEKRCRRKLPRLAKCVVCSVEHQCLNQHMTCTSCVPSTHEYQKDYRDSLNGRWQMYKSNAAKRGLEFKATLSDFAEFWKKPCSYCGDDIDLIGVDRVDSSIGYIEGNMVACCGRCNEMKNSATLDAWLTSMKRVISFMEQK